MTPNIGRSTLHIGVEEPTGSGPSRGSSSPHRSPIVPPVTAAPAVTPSQVDFGCERTCFFLFLEDFHFLFGKRPADFPGQRFFGQNHLTKQLVRFRLGHFVHSQMVSQGDLRLTQFVGHLSNDVLLVVPGNTKSRAFPGTTAASDDFTGQSRFSAPQAKDDLRLHFDNLLVQLLFLLTDLRNLVGLIQQLLQFIRGIAQLPLADKFILHDLLKTLEFGFDLLERTQLGDPSRNAKQYRRETN